MSDRTRLFITGLAALGVVAVTVSGHGLWATFRHSDFAEASVPLTSLRDFDGITLEGPDDVVVTPGDSYAVTIDGSRDAAKYLNLYVSKGVLHVGRRGHGGWFGPQRGATVRVTMPSLSRLWLAGSGDMQVRKADARAFQIMARGSGDLKVDDLTADSVQLTAMGSGDVALAGKAKELTANVSGSGSLSASDLETQKVGANVTGSGDVSAHASDSARLVVTGSGTAQVEGTTRCQIVKTGSGDAECST